MIGSKVGASSGPCDLRHLSMAAARRTICKNGCKKSYKAASLLWTPEPRAAVQFVLGCQDRMVDHQLTASKIAFFSNSIRSSACVRGCEWGRTLNPHSPRQSKCGSSTFVASDRRTFGLCVGSGCAVKAAWCGRCHVSCRVCCCQCGFQRQPERPSFAAMVRRLIYHRTLMRLFTRYMLLSHVHAPLPASGATNTSALG